jgi:beta-mannanase
LVLVEPWFYGNTAADYGAAWRHVHAIFAARGATNVRWVWCPNSEGANNHLLTELYPGDTYVDWVGLDGYNWGDTRAWSTWRSLYSIFQANYETLVAMTKNPFMIAETASAESGGDKAAWIRWGLLDDLPTHFPRIAWVLWFDILKEAD